MNIVLRAGFDDRALRKTIRRLEETIRASYPDIRRIYLEFGEDMDTVVPLKV